MTPRVSGISAFRLTTADPDRLIPFYEGLGFEVEARRPIPDAEIALLGLSGRGTRISIRLGASRVDLDWFEQPGRPYPRDATSADLFFQHFALRTDDAQRLWSRAIALGATAISLGGPVSLPISDGGVTAAKFRDPEGHPLEFLQLPGNQQRHRGHALLGIDHSAISVSELGTSRLFYEALGLSAQGQTLNHGPTQEALDRLADVEVDVLPMKPVRPTPHIELLAYRAPRGRSLGRLEANDVAATRVVWEADRTALVQDPDGHLHILLASSRTSVRGYGD